MFFSGCLKYTTICCIALYSRVQIQAYCHDVYYSSDNKTESDFGFESCYLVWSQILRCVYLKSKLPY